MGEHQEIAGPDMRATTRRVAELAIRLRYYRWDWGESIAIDGLLGAAKFLGDERILDFVGRMVRSWVDYVGSPWWPDHVGPGSALLDTWRRTGDPALYSFARGLAEHIISLPRGRLGCTFHRPDLPAVARTVWVDSMYSVAAFLAGFGHLTGEDRWYGHAAEHILGHAAVLQDESGLFCHSYDDSTGGRNGVHWSRGNGWAILGLTSCLGLLPPHHDSTDDVRSCLARLTEAILRADAGNGNGWSTVIDKPESRRESSASLMIACGLMRAAHLGLSEDLGVIGRDVWHHLWPRIDGDGLVREVSGRTPPAAEWAAYDRIPVGGRYPWGQGAYLLAASTWFDSRPASQS